MANAFIVLDVVGLDRAVADVAGMVAAAPRLIIDSPRGAAQRVADAVVGTVEPRTPVDTGALVGSTDDVIADTDKGVEIDIIQTAQNVRSGYMYAQARAFGRVSDGWRPPEEPTYPEAALLASRSLILDIAKKQADLTMLKIVSFRA